MTRRSNSRDELVRLVASPDGEVVLDYRGNLPGRGAWLAVSREAVAGLVRMAPRVAHLLGARCDATSIIDQLRAAIHAATLDGLSQAAAGGALVMGHDALEGAIQRGTVDMVMVASDAAERTVRSVMKADDPEEPVVVLSVPWTSEELGRRVGRALVAVVGVTDARPATHLRRQLRRLSALG